MFRFVLCLLSWQVEGPHADSGVRLSSHRLETDIQNLEQHLEAMRATYQLNTEKLEYNYRVLVRDCGMLKRITRFLSCLVLYERVLQRFEVTQSAGSLHSHLDMLSSVGRSIPACCIVLTDLWCVILRPVMSLDQWHIKH